MTRKHLTELRKFLKHYKATPISEEYREAADAVTKLIPSLVDQITDDELDHLMNLFADYLMISIISPHEKEQNDADSRQPSEDGNGQKVTLE